MLVPELQKIDPCVAPRGTNIPEHATAVIDIDLEIIKHNYLFLQSNLAPGCQSAAVLKANAYGLGASRIGKALLEVGCQHFFAATLEEAIELRQALKNSQISIFKLNGLLPGMEKLCLEYDITPVLNAPEQISFWAQVAKNYGRRLPAAFHIDTGLCRAGINREYGPEIANDTELFSYLDIKFILSHLACSDQPGHEKNKIQLDRFKNVLQYFPHIPASFCNSHGIFLGKDYHFQQVRPGRSLYGVGSRSLTAQGFRQAIQVYVKILQVRDVAPGESVGYNATYHISRPSRLAILSMGYADGLLRTRTHKGVFHIQGHPAYIAGRISMDLVTVDVTDVPQQYLYPGAWVEYIGDHMSVDDAAEAAGTISHEILVNLGSRYFKNYLSAGE